jgi:hypothetical protein
MLFLCRLALGQADAVGAEALLIDCFGSIEGSWRNISFRVRVNMSDSGPDATQRAPDRAPEIPPGYRRPSHGKGLLRNFPPGNAGRPPHTSTRYSETIALARASSPEAMRCLIERLRDPDGRIAVMSASLILERAFGKPREMKPEEREQMSIDLSALSAPELKILMDLAVSGRLRSVPSEASGDVVPIIEARAE